MSHQLQYCGLALRGTSAKPDLRDNVTTIVMTSHVVA
jgi:hypothetical protein